MKKLIFILLVVVSLNLCASVSIRDLYLEYNSDPSFETFTKAYNFLNITAERDTTMSPYVSYLYLSFLHKAEYERQLRTLVANVDHVSTQMKFQIANLLLGNGKYDESLEIYKIVTADLPEWSCAWRHKGEAYFMKKDFKNAERALAKSIETREGHYDAYLMLADVYYAQKKFKDAKRIIEKGFEYQAIDEKDEDEYTIEEVYFMYLNILRANKDRRAKSLETEMREKFPDSPLWNK